MLNPTELVRTGVAVLDEKYAEATDANKPKVDALRSIVRADLRDRTTGITSPDEWTPGLAIVTRRSDRQPELAGAR